MTARGPLDEDGPVSGMRRRGAGGPLESLMSELAKEFPRFRIVEKTDSPLSKAIDIALRVVTANQMSTYITEYHTVIGDCLYVPPAWQRTSDIDKIITLRHERIHLRQRRRYTLPGMAFLYLVPFFPLGLAYFRARIEWEAYTETIVATAELKGLHAARDPQLRHHIVRNFTGPSYGWMWPFRAHVERWIDGALAAIEAEHVEPTSA